MTDSVNRRDFLRLGSGALATAALGPLGVRAADEKPKQKRLLKKAMMYGTLSFKGSVLEKFKALKAAGFEGVEPNSHMDQDEVVKALEESGLKAASVCCNTHWKKLLSDPDENVPQEAVEGVQQTLKDAKRYGATSVLVVPGRVIKSDDPKKNVTYDDCFKRSVVSIRKVVPLAQDLGVKIAIENVWNDFITKPDQALAFLDAIDSPHVGWHFDIGNVIRYGKPEDWIPVLDKRILKLHIKEFDSRKETIPAKFNVKFLEGENNWPAIMKALDAVNYQGWGISEQPGDQSRDAEALKELSGRMDKVFAS